MKKHCQLIPLFVIFSFFYNNSIAQIIFQDDFESTTLNPQFWTTNSSTNDGLVEVVEVASSDVSSIKGTFYEVVIGKSRDGDVNLNTLDLRLDLSAYSQVELSFWVKDAGEEGGPRDGIYFSADGGQTFTPKVIPFNAEYWRDNIYGEMPPLDIDKLARENGVNLTSQFVIRFQQEGDRDFLSGGGNDGLHLDNVVVQVPDIAYATLPFSDYFDDKDQLGNHWRVAHAFIDGQTTAKIDEVKPEGLVELVKNDRDNAVSGFNYVAIGKRADGINSIDNPKTTNALDLYLDLSNAVEPELTFWIRDINDENESFDGLYFSDNGGQNFEQVYLFEPEGWNDRFGEFPPLNIAQLAQKNNLDLTGQFIIRFQQNGRNDFLSGGGSDGFHIDNVSVKERKVSYARVPFFDGFEEDNLSDNWRKAHPFLDGSTILDSTKVRPGSYVSLENNQNIAYKGFKYTYIGRLTDGQVTATALDLHVNLAGQSDVELKFWINDFQEENESFDGIFFSDDGGDNFQQVYIFDLENKQGYNQETLNVSNIVANQMNLNLTSQFVIRFQQYGRNDFLSGGGSNGYLLDNVEICVNGNCTPAPPSNIGITITNTLENCEQSNGTATAIAMDGTAPYTYNWNNGQTGSTINNLTAGTYTVTVTDADGTMATGSTTIMNDCQQGCTLVTTPTVNNASCEQSNGAINLNITGGNGNYIFNWSNGATTQNLTDLPTGNYAVTIFESITECNVALNVFVGDDCGGTGECDITEGILTFSGSPYTANSPGQLVDVVGNYTGNIPDGYSVRFIKNFSNRPFLSIKDIPEFRHSGAIGTKRLHYIIGQFSDANDPNYIDIDNTNFERISDLRTAIEGKCALLTFAEYEFVEGDGYILTATEAEGPANTPLLLPVVLKGGECDKLYTFQARFLFEGGLADVTILDYVSGKIDVGTMTIDTSTMQNVGLALPVGVDLSPTEDDTLFYLEVSLAGNPGDISRVYFDTIERPRTFLTCSPDIFASKENVEFGVGILRITNDIDIDGKVTFWKDGKGINNVDITLETNHAGNFSEKTDNIGDYLIAGIPTGGLGVLKPKKENTSARNGVNVQDAFLLKQYVVGTYKDANDYQRVAMEVSGDGEIDVTDALFIETVVVGNLTDFSPKPNWVFIPENHTFPVPNAPKYFDFPTELEIPDIRIDIEEPFIGVKMGDVDGSADPNNLRNLEAEDRNRRKQNWNYQTHYKQSEGLLEVTLSPKTDITTGALQSQLAWTAMDKLELVSVEAMALPSIRVNRDLDDQVRFLWVNSTGRYLDFVAETPMLQLVFKVKEGFNRIDWALFPTIEGFASIIINENNEELSLNLFKSTDDVTSNVTWTHQLFQNTPNPFTDFTTVQFSLPQSEMVNISVYDSFGKRVYEESQAYDVGKHELRLATQNWAPGIYTCTMQTTQFNAAIKMLVIR